MRGQEPADANDYTERLLAKLGIKAGQIDKLQKLPVKQLLKSADFPPPPAGVIGAGKSMPFNPVVDGHYLPVHPFHPVAAPTASEIPLIIGSNRDEAALFLANDPSRPAFTDVELHRRLAPMLGDRLERIISVYRRTRPSASLWDIYIGIMSEDRRLGCSQCAELKTAGGKAPVYMYLFTWQTDYQDYIYKSCHTLEIPFAFDNVRDVPFTGSRPDKYELAKAICGSWCAFALNGDPNHPGIPRWEPWRPERRNTMILDVPSRLKTDPFREELDAWDGMEIIP